MGALARFVLIDDSGVRRYHSRWGADRVCATLIGGPDAATREIETDVLQRGPLRDWQPDTWTEGGAVVDHTARQLIWFGDQLMYDLPTKQVFAELLRRTWPGWNVRWAYGGVQDLIAAVDVDRDHARFHSGDGPVLPDAVIDPGPGDPSFDSGIVAFHLLTVTTRHGLRIYPLDPFTHAAWQGPALLDRLPAGGVAALELPDLPWSGVHVDAVDRSIGVWLSRPGGGLVHSLPALWPGWRIACWEDRYQEQIARCGEALRPPWLPGRVSVLERVMEQLARRHRRPVVTDPLALDRLEREPSTIRGHPAELTDSEWARVLRAAADLENELDTADE
ncbi:hypothetical protein [Nocardia huaxiensis]|uniref:hypothetical protein n=1 Tax=Nocardia huaxiensis TaxID=2755382 RepID=UPI001E503DAD|nr:hypothetical protein [Nocardia huaxiensis]UFS97174.1 hypothetical protein LPY97_04390 [Nocardia huaxiensis]